jgi:hypothetical protein
LLHSPCTSANATERILPGNFADVVTLDPGLSPGEMNYVETIFELRNRRGI